MKKILILSTKVPYPLLDGIRIRVYNTAKCLSEEYKVDLYCVTTEQVHKHAEEELSGFTNAVMIRKISKLGSALAAVKSLSNGLPLQVNYYYRKGLAREIEALSRNYDLLLCDTIRTVELVKAGGTPVIADYHDSIAMHYERARKFVGLVWRMIYGFEYKRLQRFEVETAKRMLKTIVVSNVDRNYLITHGAPEDKIETINIAVRDNIDCNGDTEKRKYISYLGVMSYPPNIDAVTWFVHNVFPGIRKEFPDLYFYIIGAYPASAVRKLANESNVIVTGYVDNPFSLLKQSEFVVAPMRMGAGLQNKVVEAMAIGKAVITTSMGASGIGGEPAKHYLIADTADDFLEQCLRLLRDENERQRIGTSGIELITERFSMKYIGKLYRACVNTILGTPK